MKVTIEIPNNLLRCAKAAAAEQQITLPQFVTNALTEKLSARGVANGFAITKLAGELRHLKTETARISKIIEDEFEQIDPEDWI